jgi:hypothetical protein
MPATFSPAVSKGARTRRYHKAKEMMLDEVIRGKTEDINQKRKS